MSLQEASKDYLSEHYAKLGNIKNDFRNANLTQLIVSLTPGKSILDIGCGSGYLLSKLKKSGKAVIGIEPNQDLIELAKKIDPTLVIYKGYSDKVSQVKEQFDAITLIDVLEHIEDDENQLKKMYSKLPKNGILVLVIPAYAFLHGKRDINLGHYRRYSRKGIRKQLEALGFEIKKLRYWNMLGFFPYLFYEKVLKKELNTSMRTAQKAGILKRFMRSLLQFWFKYIENNFTLGFGLSMIVVAQKR